MELTKSRLFLVARGVQLDNGVTPPPLDLSLFTNNLSNLKMESPD